jgi:SAM-dependent methyltransferase
LAQVNARWAERLARFRRYAGPPWWAPGLIIDADLRAKYEAFLPVSDFLADLRRLAAAVLPHPTWVPRRLLPLPARCHVGPPSLPDLWADLPEPMAGRTCFAPRELLPLFCALAAPPRFGTAAGRYPQQMELLRAWAVTHPGAAIRVLDLACGTGQGTYEVCAALTAASRGGDVRVTGLTWEPLEAWMATCRRAPHDPAATRELRRFGHLPGVTFVAGDVRRMPLSPGADVVIANGIVGGPYLRGGEDLGSFLDELLRLLVPTGLVVVANRFHDGWLPDVHRFAALAGERGWLVDGQPRELRLRRLVLAGDRQPRQRRRSGRTTSRSVAGPGRASPNP